MKNCIRLLAFLVYVAPLLSLGAVNLEEIAKKVDDRYNSINSLAADFTESYKGAGISRSESGTLFLKHPGKMRWEYREPGPKLFVTDGKNAFFYVPGDHQARRASIKKLDDLRSPLRYLLGKTKLNKEFNNLAIASDVQPGTAGDIVLRGIPKGMEDRVASVLLEVSPEGEIRRIVLSEVDGSVTEFRFANQRANVPMPDQRFRFTPPPGVELVEVPDIG
ncbi:MAG: outer membrane lipoprotein chaperone LolA [Acidobacteria bacterium]|nr:outer membrane lipoprotein chaperone LolA [Acidobacteriota bacterium]